MIVWPLVTSMLALVGLFDLAWYPWKKDHSQCYATKSNYVSYGLAKQETVSLLFY